jgi:hypothetical protein
MAAKEILAGEKSPKKGAGYSDHGMGTKVSEYSARGPFHCEDCTFAVRKDVPEKGKGLCNEPHVLKDPQVPAARRSKLKVIDLEHGCCRFVNYPKGYVEKD